MRKIRKKSAAGLYVTLIIIGLIICFAVGWVAYKQGKDWVNILSVVGSVASVIGLVIVAVQIQEVRRASEATQAAVEETQARITTLLSVSDIARAIELVSQVQIIVESSQYSHARSMLQQLDNVLVDLKSHPDAAAGAPPTEYDELLKANGTHLFSLSEVINNTEKNFEPLQLSQTLERVRVVLVKFQGHLKRKGS